MYTPLSKHDVYRIHLATMEVLERIGVCVENDTILSLLEKAGAKTGGNDKTARIPEYVIRESLKKVPSSFVLHTRTGHKVRIGGEKTVVSPGADAPWILDLKTGEPRTAKKSDVEQTSRLMDALQHIDVCKPLVLPQDVYPKLVDVHAAEAMMCNTSKPYYFSPSDGTSAGHIVEMATIVAGGTDELEKKPLVLANAAATSPLRLATPELDIACRFAENHLPIGVQTCPMSGATSPVTLGGTLVTMCAECLALIVVVEIINPGNPVVAGGAPSVMDMRTANATFGSVETALMSAAISQIIRNYNLPSYTCISNTESAIPDAQAGYESAWTTLLPLMTGASLVIGPGHLNSCTLASYEKLVMDNEILGGLKRIMEGINVSESFLAVDVVSDVGPGGHFLAHKHTREYMSRERWFPRISNRFGFREWKKERCELWIKAKREAMEIMSTHHPEPLEKEKQEAIGNLVNKLERSQVD